jgi:hypothetical protein
VAGAEKIARQERSCLSKRRYWSQVDALVMASRRLEHERALLLGAYACANCGGWHLTRQVESCPAALSAPSP